MSKVIKSKAQNYTGTVTIFDRLVLSQVELVEAALLDNKTVYEDARENEKSVYRTQIDKPKLPALLACVEKWEIEGFPEPLTVDNFPLTPRADANYFIEMVFDEIRRIYNGEREVPNE